MLVSMQTPEHRASARLPDSLLTRPTKSSIRACSANLVMSILGPGQLTLPFAIHELGLNLGVSLMVVFAVLSMYSMSVLSACAREVEAASYQEMIAFVLGRKAKRVLDITMILYIWGGNVAYFVIVKTQAGIIAKEVGVGAHLPDDVLLAIVVFIFVWPLSMLKTIEKLKFTSLLGCCAALYINLVVIFCAPWQESVHLDVCGSASNPRSELEFWPSSFVQFASSTPLLAFAFNGSWAYLNVYSNLENPNSKRTKILISATTGIICFQYFTIALFGYLSFCGGTSPDILDALVNQHGWRHVMVLLARLALITQLCLQMPLRFNTAVSVIARSGEQVSFAEHAGFTTILLLTSAALAGTDVPMHTALGITSAICASAMLFIFPSLCEAKLASDRKYSNIALAALVGCVGASTLLTGTYANIQEALSS